MRNSDINNQSVNSNYSSNSEADNSYLNGVQIKDDYDGTLESPQRITLEQAYNESVIKLLVLLYQIDGKVTLSEQDLFAEITASLHWRSGVSISAFINDAIHQARVAIDQQASREFLFALGNGLKFKPDEALDYAMDITEVDGKRSEEELEVLALLSNRVLARGASAV